MNTELLHRCFSEEPEELASLFEEAFSLSRARFSDVIHFFMPSMVHYDTPQYTASNPYRFPSISVTGGACQLQCEHCKGRLLATMIPATTPQRLIEVCTRIKERGAKGCLISGGFNRDGKIPLMDFIPAMKRVKRDLGLDIVVHIGFVDSGLAKALADAEIDAAMIDIIGSNKTIKDIYHLDAKIDDLDRSLSLLEEHHIHTVPHLVVGLHYGRMLGENDALKLISKHRPTALVIVAFMPIENTPMEHVEAPQPLDIARVILASRLLMPDTPLLLGCARPRGSHKSETDILAIKAGVNGIAYPSEEGYTFARELGLKARFSEECCSLIYREFAP